MPEPSPFWKIMAFGVVVAAVLVSMAFVVVERRKGEMPGRGTQLSHVVQKHNRLGK